MRVINMRFQRPRQGGFAVLMVFLVMFVVAMLVWLDPSALFSKNDSQLPWNEEFRIVKTSEDVPPPSEEQPEITRIIRFGAEAKYEGQERGNISLMIFPDGRIEGGWDAEYYPDDKFHLQVMMSGVKGNIDSSKVYSDSEGEDPSKLYLIAKGNLLILESNLDNNQVRSVKGRLYITGWLDSEYNAKGELTVTSDKRNYKIFSWETKPSR